MAEPVHNTSRDHRQDNTRNQPQETRDPKVKGKAKVSNKHFAGHENTMSVDVGACQGGTDSLGRVAGPSLQLEPLSNRTHVFVPARSTPRRIQEWPKEQAPSMLGTTRDAPGAVGSSGCTPPWLQSTPKAHDYALESGEIPQDVISVETYMFLGWTAAKAAELFRSWQCSDSNGHDSIGFFNDAIRRGMRATADEDSRDLTYPKAYWARRLRELGINEATLLIVLDDPGADILGRPLKSTLSRPRRSILSWVRQVMHSRWFWLHWFKQIDFVGPHFADNLVSDEERWHCLSRYSASLPTEICSVQTLLFIGFGLRRAAAIYTDWKAHLDANPDPFTDEERQESFFHDALDWLDYNETHDIFLWSDNWDGLYQLVGMSAQLCRASQDALFLRLRQNLQWHSALTCLKDVLLARWRLIFRLKDLPYPGPDAETVSSESLPLSQARYGSEQL